jgi:hypothetical protein
MLIKVWFSPGYLRNVKTDNERQRAELVRKDEKIEALKSFIRSMRAECNNYKPALHNLELDNSFFRAKLRRDADKISLMRQSILKLRAKLSRGKHAKARLAVLQVRGALNVLTDGNYLSAFFCTSLLISKPGYRVIVGGKLVNGWTKLTHSACWKHWIQARAQ